MSMIPKQSIVEGNKKMHKVQTKKKEERTMDIKVPNTREDDRFEIACKKAGSVSNKPTNPNDGRNRTNQKENKRAPRFKDR